MEEDNTVIGTSILHEEGLPQLSSRMSTRFSSIDRIWMLEALKRVTVECLCVADRGKGNNDRKRSTAFDPYPVLSHYVRRPHIHIAIAACQRACGFYETKNPSRRQTGEAAQEPVVLSGE